MITFETHLAFLLDYIKLLQLINPNEYIGKITVKERIDKLIQEIGTILLDDGSEYGLSELEKEVNKDIISIAETKEMLENSLYGDYDSELVMFSEVDIKKKLQKNMEDTIRAFLEDAKYLHRADYMLAGSKCRGKEYGILFDNYYSPYPTEILENLQILSKKIINEIRTYLYGKKDANVNANVNANISLFIAKGIESGIIRGTSETTIKHYNYAATKNIAQAQRRLAILLYNSKSGNVGYNKRKGFGFLIKAALNSDYFALYLLGIHYEKGEHCKKNYTKAFQCIKKAAEDLDFTTAKVKLGTYYYKGMGTQQNYEESYKWFYEAYIQGSIEAIKYLGKFYEKGLVVKKDYKKALQYYMLSASICRSPNVLSNIGDFYRLGLGVEKNLKKAYHYYSESYMLGNKNAKAMMLSIRKNIHEQKIREQKIHKQKMEQEKKKLASTETSQLIRGVVGDESRNIIPRIKANPISVRQNNSSNYDSFKYTNVNSNLRDTPTRDVLDNNYLDNFSYENAGDREQSTTGKKRKKEETLDPSKKRKFK